MLSTDIVLIPPEQVRRRIEQVRQRFDTMWAGRVEGHISLIKPLPRHINPQEEMLLSKVFSKTEPFVVETTKLEMLSGERYYLVLGVKPHEPFVLGNLFLMCGSLRKVAANGHKCRGRF